MGPHFDVISNKSFNTFGELGYRNIIWEYLLQLNHFNGSTTIDEICLQKKLRLENRLMNKDFCFCL